MIITVKAWLHAKLDWRDNTIYDLHSFQTPLGDNSVMIREEEFKLIMPDTFDLKQILADNRKERLEKQLGEAKVRVMNLEAAIRLSNVEE